MSTRPRVVASVEARMGSSRLPGKVLMDVEGSPALAQLIRRLKNCQYLDDIVVATSEADDDRAIETCAHQEGVQCFRGSEEDVLNRVVNAHVSAQSELIVEITGDCPLLDSDVVDMGIKTFLENQCDVVSNTAKLSFPQGADVQVFRFKDLEWVEKNISDSAVREHVSLYFYENPQKYNIIHLQAPPRWYSPELRFQLDYPEDLEFIRQVYHHLAPTFGHSGFGVEEVLSLLRREPHLKALNGHCEEKAVR